MTSKVLKVLKVLNFSGTGKTNIFTCTFTAAAVNPYTLPRMTLTPALSLCAGRGGSALGGSRFRHV